MQAISRSRVGVVRTGRSVHRARSGGGDDDPRTGRGPGGCPQGRRRTAEGVDPGHTRSQALQHRHNTL